MAQQQLDFSPPPPRIPRQSIGAWLVTKAFIAFVTWPFILGLSALVGYRPSAVDNRRFTGERQRWPFLTGVSVVLWLSGLVAVLASIILTPIALVVVVPLMILTAARVASSPYGLPVADLVAGARDLWSDSPRWRKAAQIALGLTGLATVLGGLLYVGRALYWSLPGQLELVAVGAVALATLLGMIFAREIGARHRDGVQRVQVSQSQLAAAVGGLFGMTAERVLEAGIIQPSGDSSFVLSPVPAAAALRGRDELESRVAQLLPDMTITSFTADRIDLGLAPEEVLDSRAVMAQSSGLIVGVSDEPDTELRPKAVRWTLASGTSPAQAAQAQALARTEGLALIEWAPYEAFAIAAKLTPLAQQVRAAVAAGFGVVDRPWEVEVELTPGEADDVPVAEVRVIRTPAGLADRRGRALADALLRIPGGNADWKIADDLIAGTAVLTHRPKRVLPGLVRLADMQAIKTDWSVLPIGLDALGEPVSLRIGSAPHALLVGPTNSGKSVAMTTAIVGALHRGHEVIVLDAMKSALDFMPLEPWVRYTGRTLDEVAAAIVAIYDEGSRRKAVLQQHRVPKWSRLPQEVRDAENIRPLTIVVDEYTATIIERKIPSTLPKDAPLRLEAERANASKAYIAMYVGAIAREMRFVGLHLQVALQRPDAKLLDGEIRQNLTSRVQLVPPGEIPARETLGMILTTPAQVESAYAELTALDDGVSPGIGVVAGESGAARVVRVAYADETELAGLLADVPHAMPFEVPLLSHKHAAEVPAESAEAWAIYTELRDAVRTRPKLKELHQAISDEGFVFPRITSAGGKTGRLTCTGPALFNLPRELRPLLIAEEGRTLVGADLSQMEPRVAAILSQDAVMAADLAAGDPYALLASRICGQVIDKEDPRRDTAKTAFLATIYGQGVRRLAANLGVGIEHARSIRASVSAAWPVFNAWCSSVQAASRRGERLFTVAGRPLRQADAPYKAVNYSIQGSAADLFLLHMIPSVGNALVDAGISDGLFLPVHDELTLQVPLGSEQLAVDILSTHMQKTVHGVTVAAKPKVLGPAWGHP